MQQARRRAAEILDSPELLMYYAISRNEVGLLPNTITFPVQASCYSMQKALADRVQQSTVATRHHFTKVLCGFDEPAKERKEKAVIIEAQNYAPYTGPFEL